MGDSEEVLDLSTIWVALGMARDTIAVRANRLPEHNLKRVNEMQFVRDKVENRIRMLHELEEYDYGL